jgi:outer membrane lipoprotein-sorting protein
MIYQIKQFNIMKNLKIINQLFFISLLSFLSVQTFGQFQANMHFILSGIEKDFKIFSDENRYRYEFNEDGQEGVVIVLNETNEVFVLMPQQKMAIKTISSSQMSMANDPVKLYEYQVNEGGKEKVIGKETINGYDCTKKELYGSGDQLLYTMWYSEKYNFPIKIVSNIDVAGSTNMEIKDIKAWKPDNAHFEIPEGYMIMDQQTMMPEH